MRPVAGAPAPASPMSAVIVRKDMMQQPSMELLWRSSHIAGGNASYVEDLYETYLRDPNAVPEQWRDYFDKLPLVESQVANLKDIPHSTVRDRFARISKMRVRTEATV